MKRYRFRLEPVLLFRRCEQDAARGALLAASARVATEELCLAERHAAYATVVRTATTASAAEFRREQLRREALGAAVVEQRRRLERAQDEQSLARDAWSVAAARVGALERLEERAREQHRRAEQREDDLLADELVVARYGREVG